MCDTEPSCLCFDEQSPHGKQEGESAASKQAWPLAKASRSRKCVVFTDNLLCHTDQEEKRAKEKTAISVFQI